MSDERTNDTPRPVPPRGAGPTPDTTPAAKEEIATDVSEVARARLSGTDKTQTSGSIAEDAVDAAPGLAGTPADDDTAAAVEDAPTAVLGKSHPGPGRRGEQGPDAPTPTPPAGAAGAPPPMTATGGGSQAAPAATQPAGTGAPTQRPTPASTQTPASPAQGAPSGPAASGPAPATPPASAATAGSGPASASADVGAPAAPSGPGATVGPPADVPVARPGNGAARAADPDHTATGPTAPDATPTAADRASEASGQAVTDVKSPPGGAVRPAGVRPASTDQPGSPATAAAAGDGAAKPAPAARPAAAAGARPAAGAKPAAAAAPPKPPEPDPEEVTSLRSLVPDLTWERRHGYLEVKIPQAQLVHVARAVKGLGYDYLSAVTAVDWRDRVEMLYHCYGWDYVTTPGCLVLRADLPPEPNPLCPSLTTVWAGAELQEREIYDLFGVKFVGHPDLRRILLDDNFPGHPLRKDWTFDYEYVLVKHLKYGAEGQDAPPGGEEGFRRV